MHAAFLGCKISGSCVAIVCDGSGRVRESVRILKSLDPVMSERDLERKDRGSSRSGPDLTRGSSDLTIAHLRHRKSADNQLPSPLESERREIELAKRIEYLVALFVLNITINVIYY